MMKAWFKNHWPLLFVVMLFTIAAISPASIFAQASLPSSGGETPGAFSSAGPSTIANTFYSATQSWINGLKGPAQALFWGLAGIDFTWTCISLVLQHQELYPWMGGLIRKILTIGFYATLLQNGSDWIADIVNFFVNLGGSAGGVSVSSLSASGIMGAGIQLAGHMLHSAASASQTGAVTNPITLLISGPSSIGTTLFLFAGAVLMVGAYMIVALHLVMSMVEAYVTVGAGYIFLGFGGSRWTLPYTEKYLGMVVAAGIRIMVLELLIGLGSNLYPQWDQMAQKISAIPDLMDGGTVGGQWSGIELEAALVTSIAIYGLLCWMIPRLASNVVQGGLSMSGGDVIASGAAVASTGLAAASLLSGSSQSSSRAVAEVAHAAAMKGAEMGVQLGMAAMTGGAGGAVAGASNAASMSGASGVGRAAGISAMDGFTPPPPSGGTPDAPGGGSGSAGGWSDRTPPPPSSVSDVNDAARGRGVETGDPSLIGSSSGVEVTAQESKAAQTEGELAASSETSANQNVSTVSEAARDAGAENEAKEPAPMNPQALSTETSTNPAKGTEISSSSGGNGEGSTPRAPTGRSSASGVINTLKTIVNEGERALNKLPNSGGHVGGTTPKMDHGE